MTYEVTWDEHPRIMAINKFVEDTFGKSFRDYFYTTGYRDCENFEDFKASATQLIDDTIEELNELKTKIQELPDSRESTFTIEDEEDEVVEDEEVV